MQRNTPPNPMSSLRLSNKREREMRRFGDGGEGGGAQEMRRFGDGGEGAPEHGGLVVGGERDTKRAVDRVAPEVSERTVERHGKEVKYGGRSNERQ